MSQDEEFAGDPAAPVDLIHRIAQLTRMLRESMRALGLDQAIKDAAQAIPDARDRLHYVARMTEQAANRVLNAAEKVQPLQDQMRREADGLNARWQAWFDHPAGLAEARELVDDTRALLRAIPAKTQATQDSLMEIIMAQDFQDLTGQVIMRMMDILLTLPTLLLAIIIVAILGPGIVNALIAVAIVLLPHYVRIVRATVIAETAKDYVTAARLTGASNLRLIVKEILPNCAAPLIVQATLGISTAILDAAALGFIGLGAQPPTPEWGTMLADAREFVLRAWWVVTFPGIMILITVLAFNLLGDGLRDALDPKLKR